MYIRSRILSQICFCCGCMYVLLVLLTARNWQSHLNTTIGIFQCKRTASVDHAQPLRELSSKATNYYDEKTSSKRILMWTPLFPGMEFLSAGSDTFKRYGCPESRCEITFDRNLFNRSHAVVFHARTLSLVDVPLHRKCQQKWIFFSLESPPYSYYPGFQFMVNMFNWTMTYRDDSDIVITYGRVYTREKHRKSKNLQSIWQTKTKMVISMVSHCSTSSNREGYVRELQKYLDVDIIGICGMAVCPFNKTDLCLKNFAKQYKFYLTFENAICDGYITEKLYRVLKLDIVPVVLGGGNYTAKLPPKSYINALDYTPKELAEYMYRLGSNASLYLEFFDWKQQGYEVQDDVEPCNLCGQLHSTDFFKTSHYENLSNWWVQKSNCKKWKKPNSSNFTHQVLPYIIQ